MVDAFCTPSSQVVHEMEQAGVEPNRYTYTVLLNCLARRRKVVDGFHVRKAAAALMPSVGLAPASLIIACELVHWLFGRLKRVCAGREDLPAIVSAAAGLT